MDYDEDELEKAESAQPEQRETAWGVFERVAHACVSEFLGTSIYVFVGCMVTPGGGGRGALSTGQSSQVVPIALCNGFTIAALMLTFSKLSGGHFNPVVSLASAVAGGLTPVLLLPYVAVQVLGGMFGAGLCLLVQPNEVFRGSLGAEPVLMSVGAGTGLLCEFALTVILVVTFLLTTLDERTRTHAAPLAVGFSVIVCVIAGVRITGASMNPARSFGPAVVLSLYTREAWSHHYVYWLGPGLAALLTALFYRYLFCRRKQVCRPNTQHKYAQLKQTSRVNSTQ